MEDHSGKILRIVKDARDSLGKFCVEECSAYCCRHGYLILSEENVETVTKGKEKAFSEGKLKLLQSGKYSFCIREGCPNLDFNSFHCRIYKDKNRPKACDEFPINVDKKTIILSSRCLAVRENKLFGYMKELENLGCRIIECDSEVDILMNFPDGIIKGK